MSESTIFNEAILEAKRLREVAEANATNALIEAVTPRVRKMIEAQLLGEATHDDDVEEGDVLADMAQSIMSGPGYESDDKLVVDLDELDEKEDESKEEKDDSDDEEVHDKDDEDLLLQSESVEALVALIEGELNGRGDNADSLSESLDKVRSKLDFAKELSESTAASTPDGKVVLGRLVGKLLSETKNLQNKVIDITRQNPDSDFSALGTDIQRVQKEIVTMASRKQVLEEGSEVFEIDLAELGLNEGDMDEMYEEDEVVDMEMDAASDDVEEGDVEIPEDLAKQLLDILQGELEADDDEEVEVALDVEDDESEEADEDEEDAEDMDDDDEVVEIDETMLKRELARMRGTLDEGDMDAHFGGGSEDKEVFVDGKDDDLNVHAGDLGTVSEARLRTALKNESRQNRALRKQVSGYKQVTAKLQEQLEQMNLFNAKLLYVNKLMQNESISRKQLKAIVESVDKAETLREVRLVYKTLTESAGKRRKSRPMNESRRPGSASRASRSGGANNSNEHASRWATLAGIKE